MMKSIVLVSALVFVLAPAAYAKKKARSPAATLANGIRINPCMLAADQKAMEKAAAESNTVMNNCEVASSSSEGLDNFVIEIQCDGKPAGNYRVHTVKENPGCSAPSIEKLAMPPNGNAAPAPQHQNGEGND